MRLSYGIRKEYKDELRAIKEKKSNIETLEKSKKGQEKELKSVQEELDGIASPFKQHLDNVLESLSLARQIYRSGAVIGKDVHKLLIREDFKKISAMFPPKMIKGSNNTSLVFGGFALAQKNLHTVTQTFKMLRSDMCMKTFLKA